MQRRQLLSGAAAVLCCPSVFAQTHRAVRIGMLSNLSETRGSPLVACFEAALANLGWRKGHNLDIVYKWAGGKSDQFPNLAEDLVRLKLDLIAVVSTPAAQAMQSAAKNALSTTPVVFMSVSDPVASGIVESLARPGGLFTGVSNVLPSTAAKMLEYVRLAAPTLKHVTVIRDKANPGKSLDVSELKAGGQTVGVTIFDHGVENGADIDRAFENMREQRPDALIVLVDGVTLLNRERIVQKAEADRYITIYQVRDFVDSGGLMSFGLDFCRHFAQAAGHANRILRGAQPQNLPVEQPTAFELVLNAKAAARYGISFPSALYQSADEVIE